jgi:hypothetical protein
MKSTACKENEEDNEISMLCESSASANGLFSSINNIPNHSLDSRLFAGYIISEEMKSDTVDYGS